MPIDHPHGGGDNSPELLPGKHINPETLSSNEALGILIDGKISQSFSNEMENFRNRLKPKVENTLRSFDTK